jgi:integrase
MYCVHADIRRARHFTEHHLCLYRKWLVKQDYADKTVEGAVILAKQVFKWAWRQRLLSDYWFASTLFPKAKAQPQPCFTSEQADALIHAAEGEEKLACALMGYAGLRIGEVEQLRWDDLHMADGRFTMIHVKRGGSSGTTKDKDERFVPIHPSIASLLGPPTKKTGRVFKAITERQLLKRLKVLCGACGFENPTRYKLHSFRHHFASLCANHHVAYRKALAWLGHSSSQMLDLYYHLHDEDSQNAMRALAESASARLSDRNEHSPFKGNLRATNQSKIEKTLQVPEVQGLVACLADITERAGFEPAVGVYTPTTV